MTLPPGFLDEIRARVPLSRIVGRKVAWDARRSNRAKGDWWAPCPFHEERTASFHVDDRKGFYYCFGCHAKGDAVSFLREAEGLGFLEAVAILAAEAGLPMPARDPEEARRAEARRSLAEVVEQAVRFYRLQLAAGAGAEARAYLARRGLGGGAAERFGLGYAPAGRTALLDALGARGIPPEALIEAGLAARPEDGGPPYDRFRDRLMFPIRDLQGRAIGFGARALRPDQQPKYLNSPETALFDKGRTLYNAGPARAAVAKGAPLILAEGYMDVIALSEAGFGGAVAPLGTAVTADQLALLWRIAPEPIVALDGDAAGLRAAERLIDLALPMIGPGQGLRFALLPGGMDPDDLIRASGPGAMGAVLDAAEPMVALLWRRETADQTFDSPERRAALDRRLAELLRAIADPGLRRHYEEDLRARRARLFAPSSHVRAPTRAAPGAAARAARPEAAPASAFRGRGQAGPASGGPAPATRRSYLAAAPPGGEAWLREALVLATLALHPGLVPAFEDALDRMQPQDPALEGLRRALLSGGANALAAPAQAALERLLARPDLRVVPVLRNPGDAAAAEACLREAFARIEALRGLAEETAAAAAGIAGFADEGVTWRVREAARAVERAARAAASDAGAPEEDRAALRARIDAVLNAPGLPKK